MRGGQEKAVTNGALPCIMTEPLQTRCEFRGDSRRLCPPQPGARTLRHLATHSPDTLLSRIHALDKPFSQPERNMPPGRPRAVPVSSLQSGGG